MPRLNLTVSDPQIIHALRALASRHGYNADRGPYAREGVGSASALIDAVATGEVIVLGLDQDQRNHLRAFCEREIMEREDDEDTTLLSVFLALAEAVEDAEARGRQFDAGEEPAGG